jgi:phospholipid/cholesterol/gamma-HCH transport system ATP-binding protein
MSSEESATGSGGRKAPEKATQKAAEKGEQKAVRFDNVSKSFGETHVLRNVSFEVERGQAFCILGRSGVGKSVTLKLTIALMKPDSGRVWVEGDEIHQLDSQKLAAARRHTGFLFQNSALFDSISVGENVAFPIRRNTSKPENEVRDTAREKLALVGLESDYDKMPAELSGGMKKRAGLARAMALDPEILLVDEPSAGLDPITSSEIDDLLCKLRSEHKTTLVIVTHHIPSARRIAGEMILLHEAAILAQGTPRELEQSDDELVRRFMQSAGGA